MINNSNDYTILIENKNNRDNFKFKLNFPTNKGTDKRMVVNNILTGK